MNTVTTSQIVCSSSDETERFGEQLGRSLRGGEVVELISDLGGGKTTLVRGIAQGMGSQDHVSSPTFKISNIYKAKKLSIHHFDFYRLSDAGLMEHELHEIIGDPESVIILEWAEAVQHVLPSKRLTIRFKKISENGRELNCTYPAELAYLLEQA